MLKKKVLSGLLAIALVFGSASMLPEGVLDTSAGITASAETSGSISYKVLADDLKMANKPEQVKIKIIEGKLDKFYSENCLLEQAFVKDDKQTVGAYVDSVAKKLGGKIDVVEYVRFERGEGVEKKEDNFADEVASMIK